MRNFQTSLDWRVNRESSKNAAGSHKSTSFRSYNRCIQITGTHPFKNYDLTTRHSGISSHVRHSVRKQPCVLTKRRICVHSSKNGNSLTRKTTTKIALCVLYGAPVMFQRKCALLLIPGKLKGSAVPMTTYLLYTVHRQRADTILCDLTLHSRNN